MKQTKMAQILVSWLISCLLLWSLLVSPVLAEPSGVEITFFHSNTCPHCLKEKPVLEEIARLNEEVELNSYEVQEQPQIWQEFRQQHQLKSAAVPRTIIGDQQFVGYSEGRGKLEYNPVYQGYIGYHNQIMAAIEAELGHPLTLAVVQPDAAATPNSSLPWQILSLPVFYLLIYLIAQRLRLWRKLPWGWSLIAVTVVSLFGFFAATPDVAIKEFAQSLPFPLFVTLIALADGFNPCAFTVLIILLSLLTHTRSRQQMAVIGSTFVATSAVMYFGFIMAMIFLGSLFLAQYGAVAMVLLGIIVAIAGLINLKDYFWFKQGFSLSLSSQQQLTFSKKARKISRQLQGGTKNKGMLFAALGGTIILGVFVNIIELGCTAILPAVYMTSLIQYCSSNLWLCAVWWTAVYAVVYIIPLVAILANFIYSFKSSRLSTTQGRRLKLVAGIFMLFFGLAMVFQPELLTFS